MFHELKNPPQWLLEGLMKEATSERSCPDCAVGLMKKHTEGCDVARCLTTGDQRLCCDCGDCKFDIWDGKWPGTNEAYAHGFVCYDDLSGQIMFDYNRLYEEKEKKKEKKEKKD